MWPFRRYRPNEETLRAFEEADAYDRGEIEQKEYVPYHHVSSRSEKRYTVVQTSAFERDVKRLEKQGADLGELDFVVEALSKGCTLGRQYRDHPLQGNWKGKRECHISNDWILIYEKKERELILHLLRTGSHSELLDR